MLCACRYEHQVAPSLPRAVLEGMDARGELRRNYIKPPVRDTVNVPDGGYVIIRFVANNPGRFAANRITPDYPSKFADLLL